MTFDLSTIILFDSVNCIDFIIKNQPEKSDLQKNLKMPKQIKDIKEFILTSRRTDAKSVRIKKNKENVKFKVRCSKYLYTLVLNDNEKAEKLRQSLPPGLEVKEIK